MALLPKSLPGNVLALDHQALRNAKREQGATPPSGVNREGGGVYGKQRPSQRQSNAGADRRERDAIASDSVAEHDKAFAKVRVRRRAVAHMNHHAAIVLRLRR